jgi:hypothetical protein
VVLAEFGFQKLDEVGDVPRDGHVASHGKFRAGEEGIDLAEEVSVRMRFEQGDEVAKEGDVRRGAESSEAISTTIAAHTQSLSLIPPKSLRLMHLSSDTDS